MLRALAFLAIKLCVLLGYVANALAAGEHAWWYWLGAGCVVLLLLADEFDIAELVAERKRR